MLVWSVCQDSESTCVAAAHEVMKVVKLLVQRGITIVATIHCPPPHTFRSDHLFTWLLLFLQFQFTQKALVAHDKWQGHLQASHYLV